MLIIRIIFLALALFSISAEAVQKGNQLSQEQYTPPEMPEYPKSYEDIFASLAGYYQAERPIDYFFEL